MPCTSRRDRAGRHVAQGPGGGLTAPRTGGKRIRGKGSRNAAARPQTVVMSTTASERPLRGLTGCLARRFTPRGAPPGSAAGRTALGEMQAYVSMGFSAVLSVVKALLGTLSGSVSLLADAVNNLADVGSSLIIALSFRVSRKPRDREHPFGHGRAETVATLVLAIFLVGVAFEVARSGFRRLLHPVAVDAPWWLTAAVLVTVLLKGWLAVFSLALARHTRSKTLEADAWNHLADIASTALVVVALVGARTGAVRLDGYAALGVSLFIGYTGYRYIREAVDTLIGEAPSAEDLERLRAVAASMPGVRGVHDAIVHSYGDLRMMSLHIEVDAELSVLAAHGLAERVEQRIAEAEGLKAIVHVDPVDRTHPAYARAEKTMNGIVEAHPEMVGFHDLRLHGEETAFELAVDLVVHAGVLPEAFPSILADVRDRLHARLPGCGPVDLGVETEYATDREHRRRFTLPPGEGARRGPHGP